MPTKKKTTRRKATPATARPTTRARRAPARGPRRAAGKGLSSTWQRALRTLENAEKQAEKEIRAFVKRSNIDSRQARALWKRWNARLDHESRRAARQIEAGLADLQTRARRESRAFGRMLDDAVERTLSALNIPSREEVQQLTRKVNQLSRKIDAFQR